MKKGLLALCLIAALAAPLARAEVRVLVWAADYRAAGNPDLALPNTMVDARSVVDLFRKLGVRDLRLIENPGADTWDAETLSLAERLSPDDVALLYYAGHAVQVNGENFFLAGDGTTLIPSEQVLLPIMARAKGTVFLIDACRDNPFLTSGSMGIRAKAARSQPPSCGSSRSASRSTPPSARSPLQSTSRPRAARRRGVRAT